MESLKGKGSNKKGQKKTDDAVSSAVTDSVPSPLVEQRKTRSQSVTPAVDQVPPGTPASM